MTAGHTRTDSLQGWLEYLERLHPVTIDMGLERVQQVSSMLGLSPGFPIITVGGTNGKGSTCAMLEAVLGCAGYRTGCYTSPHLQRYNERVRIDRQEISDRKLCQAFEAVETARLAAGISLTYFEFGTLAAMHCFIAEKLDVVILEVGLGGRLDAVNVFDPDCAILATIDLDHMHYLGDSREKIGYEKAGIFRKGKPAVCADSNPPDTVHHHASAIEATLLCIGKDFSYQTRADNRLQWDYSGVTGKRYGLPYPALRGMVQLRNASACLAALDTLADRLPVSMGAVRQGLMEVTLPGRFQVLPQQPGQPVTILDVAHNPDAARNLATNLADLPGDGRTWAVFAMLADKDSAGVVQALQTSVDIWCVAGVEAARGASAGDLAAVLSDAGMTEENGRVFRFPGIIAAYRHACRQAGKNDRICVFGSFYTVAEVLRYRNTGNQETN